MHIRDAVNIICIAPPQIIGVVCENAVAMAKRNEKENQKRILREQNRVMESLRSIFEATDQDGSGTIDLKEYSLGMIIKLCG